MISSGILAKSSAWGEAAREDAGGDESDSESEPESDMSSVGADWYYYEEEDE